MWRFRGVTGDRPVDDETWGMPHRKPTTAGTVFLVALIAAVTIPGTIVVVHDSLPRRLPLVEQHRSGD